MVSKINLKGDATHSIVSRLFLLFVTLTTVLLNTHYLGAAGLGSIALLQFGLLLVTGMSGFVAAGAVVYVRRTYGAKEMRWVAYAWCAMSAIVASGSGVALGVIPEEWLYDAAILGFLQSLIVFHSQMLIASGKIVENNMLQLGQTIFLLAAVSIQYLMFDNATPDGFARALGMALASALVISIAMLHGTWDDGPTVAAEDGDVRRKLFRHGAQGSTGSILQMLTNRSNLSLLEHTVGSAGAGVYSVVYYGAEAVWTIARALAPMVNNEVAVASSSEIRMGITRRYLKLTLILTLPLVAAAALVPEFVYEWVFGISGIAWPIRLLAPGMIAGAVSSILAHHLSGVGLHKWNAITSALGLAVLLGIGGFLVKDYGVQGAAIAASCAYCAQSLGLIWVWSKKG